LSFDELIAVDTWLFAREGAEPPTPEEIENAYKRFIPESERPKAAPAGGAPGGAPAPGAPVVTGDEPVNEIFIKALCFACHTIPGIQGAVGVVGPKLVEKTNAPQRLKDPAYKGKATTVREYIMESILTPSTYVVKPFPDNIMPKDFGKKLNAAAINKVIDYLSQLEEGKAPPKIQ
jgi:cytochrome c